MIISRESKVYFGTYFSGPLNEQIFSFLDLSVTQLRRGFNEPVNVHRL